jgi:RimJ/RimL family protein N-acetyltransferase
MQQPILRSRRLILRSFVSSDAVSVERLAGAREVADTTLNIPHPYPPGAAHAWIASHAVGWAKRRNVVYAITLPSTDELVGAISLGVSAAHAQAEIGYWIGLEHWNQGYCTEAGRILVRFGFETLGLHRIEGRHLMRNPASGRVLTKLGMRLEGIHRDAIRKWDRFEDIGHHAVLATDEGVPPDDEPTSSRRAT